MAALPPKPTTARTEAGVPAGGLILTVMFKSQLSNKPVLDKAIASEIRQLARGNRSFEVTMLGVISCYERAQYWDVLSAAERITLELRWTDSVDQLLTLGNEKVLHSIRYWLREQTPEDVVEGP